MKLLGDKEIFLQQEVNACYPSMPCCFPAFKCVCVWGGVSHEHMYMNTCSEQGRTGRRVWAGEGRGLGQRYLRILDWAQGK